MTESSQSPPERRFRWAYHNRHRETTQKALLVGAVLFAACAAMDVAMFPGMTALLLTVRLVLVVPAILLVWHIAGTRRFYRIREPVMTALVLWSGSWIAIMMTITGHPQSILYLPSLMLVLLFGYVFAKLPCSVACAAGWGVVGFFAVAAGRWGHGSPFWLLVHGVVLTTANVAGMVACHSLESLARHEFFRSRDRAQRPQKGDETLRRAHLARLREEGTQEAARRRQKHIADRDALTGVYNRQYGERLIDRFTRNGSVSGERFAVLLVELDHFGRSTETVGSQVTDAVLKKVATRLQGALRSSDVVARLDGDEFLIVLPNILRRDVVERVVRRLLSEISRPYCIDGRETVLTVRIGVAIHPHDGSTPDRLLASAGSAGDQAKRESGNCYRFFAEEVAESSAPCIAASECR